MALEDGMTVRVHYRGTLDDGTEFDSSTGRDPLEFTVGAGQVIPGFEDAVSELGVGEKAEVRLDPEHAYGDHIAEAIQTVPLTAFADEPSPGAMVQLQAPDGRTIAATVTEIGDEAVVLDFNHPLAGKALNFEIELVGVVAGD